MPGAVGRTSTYALCNVTLPWVLQIANRGIKSAAETLKPIARAINIADGKITNQAVAATFGMPWDKRFEAHPTGL
jgi:alanine dehydrogenase